ncbi:MAG: FtsX-like permease family protein [Bacteroidales bacterium]|nr:FtsX-like permease family protein [Bacteroidales bacterium]
MFKNYLLTAIRNIKRDLFYSGINILGLAMGMSCSILIMLWVYDEVSYDRFHEDSSMIYRIIARLPQTHIAVGPIPLAKSLKEEYPEIQEAVNLNFNNDVELRVDEIILKDNIGLYTSSEFFKIFNIKIIEKQTDSLLSNTNEIILTQSLAQKIFGNENPIGKSITVNINKEYMVSAIIEDYPSNSHFEFDFIVDIFSNDHLKASEDNWGTFMCFPYIKIYAETNIDTLRKKVEFHFNKIYGEDTKAGTIGLQSLEDIHLKSSHLQELYATLGDIKYVKIFALVSIFILIIACINFMNLSTAKAAKRLTDVGIRKVVGAKRGQLIAQYLGESLFIAFIAMLFALLFVDFMLPVFNTISQKNITMEVFSFKEIIWLVFITIITGLISGSYTAIYLSGIKSTQILSKEPIRGKSGKYFKQALVITQFTISIALIIVSLIVKNQLHYIQNKNLGYKIENQLVLDLGGDFTKDFTSIKAKLLENPDVKNVTSSSSLPVNIIQGTYGGDWPGKDPESQNLINTCEVDHEFINTLELELIEGRDFSPILNVDTGSYIINESAVKLMDLEDPIGTEITVARKTAKIIGVIKDFHFTSMHSSIGPLVISRVESSDFLILKIDTKNIQSTIQDISKRISENFPNYSFSYKTLTDQYNELYTNEQRIGKMFNYFAILAILLSCLGLFGLSAYSAEQRTKEIGIRKALGGSISSIVFILEREFIKWVVISNIIAWPVAYYFAKNWLESFTYKIEISVFLFAMAMIITFIVAVLTVFFQAYRAASKNPTESLRYE